MKAYKILALLKRVGKMKAGDKRVLINGYPCKVDYRIIADDLFEDAVSAMKELIESQEQVKNYSIPTVSNLDCKHKFHHVEEIAVVVCTNCKEILGRQSDC